MDFFGIIPARFQSTRFPGKPLADINGKPMIQRVYEQALKAERMNDVIVATDDIRIFEAVESFGGKVVMTSESHSSGTDRCFEAASNVGLELNENTVIVNIQGDEPYINPEQIEQVCDCFEDSTVEIATLVKKIENQELIFDPNVVKCVFSNSKRAIYFSRSPIPFVRKDNTENWIINTDFYKHIGIYAYRGNVLKQIVSLPISTIERSESLEQLRWLENDIAVSIGVTDYESVSVDVPEDILKIKD